MNRSFVLFRYGFLLLAIVALRPLAAQEIHSCVVMPAPPAPYSAVPSPRLPGGVQKAVALGREGRTTTNFWPNGSTLRVRFLGGSVAVRQKVERYAREWTQYANLNFQFVTSGPGDIRVSFVRNGSSWSMLGRQASRAPSQQATMNFGWFTDRTSDAEFRRTVLHEFGHALGLLHEHQNPEGGIPWNEEAVYAHYLRTQGWDQRTTHHNVIARQRRDETQYSAYDARSIMHYPVDSRLTRGNYSVGLNGTLSPTDIAFIRKLYPGRETQPTAPGPATSTTSAPTRRTQPTERPTAPTSRPATERYEVGISNQLGKGVRAEVVELSIADRKYTFRLRQGEQTRKAIRLQMPPGTYDYGIRTASIYRVNKRVWDGRRYVNRPQDRTVYGDGRGKLTVSRDGNLTFYGKYDRESQRMKVWLGERQQVSR